MKDFFGREIKSGDVVVYADGSRSPFLSTRVVLGETHDGKLLVVGRRGGKFGGIGRISQSENKLCVIDKYVIGDELNDLYIKLFHEFGAK
jgi:hypothetical protein